MCLKLIPNKISKNSYKSNMENSMTKNINKGDKWIFNMNSKDSFPQKGDIIIIKQTESIGGLMFVSGSLLINESEQYYVSVPLTEFLIRASKY